jgi:hypothetical protein
MKPRSLRIWAGTVMIIALFVQNWMVNSLPINALGVMLYILTPIVVMYIASKIAINIWLEADHLAAMDAELQELLRGM